VIDAQRRPVGRPKGSGVRTAVVRLRLEPAAKARWEAAARGLGVTLTEWLCEAAEAFARDEPRR